MGNMLEIKNMSFRYDTDFIFKKMNFNIKKNKLVYMIGNNNSGKTTLINILKYYPFDGEIYINELRLCNNNLNDISKIMNIIDIDYVKNCKLIEIKEMFTNEKNIQFLKDYQKLQIPNKTFNKFTVLEKIKTIIFLNLINDIQFLIIDEVIDFLGDKDRTLIYRFIKKYQKRLRKTVLIISSNSEGIIFADQIVVLNKGKIVFDNNINSIEKNENIFNDLSIKLPFIVDLSIKLKLYNLINKIYVDEKRMINDIWKK